MVSLNWSAPLSQHLRRRQAIDLLPCPASLGDPIRHGLDYYLSASSFMEEFIITESSMPSCDDGISGRYFPLYDRISGELRLDQLIVTVDDDIDILMMAEGILVKSCENRSQSFEPSLLNSLELFEDIFDDTNLSMKDLLLVSDHHHTPDLDFNLDFDLAVNSEDIRILQSPIFCDNIAERLQLPQIAELDIGSIECSSISSNALVYAFTIQDAAVVDSCDMFEVIDEGSDSEIVEMEEVAFPRNVTEWTLENALSSIESKLEMLEGCQDSSHSVILSPENYYRLLKRFFTKLQFYNPEKPEPLDVPDLLPNLQQPVDHISSLQLEPFVVKLSMNTILYNEFFSLWTVQYFLNKIIQDLKSSLPIRGAPYYDRFHSVAEEFDSHSMDQFLAPVIQTDNHSIDSAPTYLACSLVSPSSIAQGHGSVAVSVSSMPLPRQQPVQISKAKRATKKHKQQTLQDFITLTTMSRTVPKAQKLSKVQEVIAAPSSGIQDAIELFRYAASTCTEYLQVNNYLHANESFFDVTAESAKSLAKRVFSRLRQCDQDDSKHFVELCFAARNTLMFASLRHLVDTLIHSGLTFCLKHLSFELQKSDLRSALRLDIDSPWSQTLHELHLRLDLLFRDVCQGTIYDHPKIDILMDEVQSGTVVIVNHRALVPILLVSMLNSEKDLSSLAYEQYLDYEQRTDVLFAYGEDIYRDDKFPWTSFRKLIIYEGNAVILGEYLTELIEEERISCLVLKIEEKHYVSRKHCPSISESSSYRNPPTRCIIASADIAEQNIDICEDLLAQRNDLEIIWREKNILESSFITSRSSIVILRAIPDIDQAQSFIASISELYIKYRQVTLIIIHDVDAIIQSDFAQVQMWLIAGLASSRIGFTCEIVFVTVSEEITTTLDRDISMQKQMDNIAPVPSDQELFLSTFPSVNPAMASEMIQSGHSLARLLTATLTELKSWFPDLNPISVELFHDFSHAQTTQQTLTIAETPQSLPATQGLSSGGYRRSPEQSTAGTKRKKSVNNNHRLEDYWVPSTKRSSTIVNQD